MRLSISFIGSLLTIGLVFACLLSLTVGPAAISFSQALEIIWHTVFNFNNTEHSSTTDQIIVLELRLPRTLMAVFIGIILAQSGAVMQGLFRNPLADPGIIGVSAGAALGAIIAIVLLPKYLMSYTTPLCAFLGGLGTTLLVYQLAKSTHGTRISSLLLAGIAISAFAGALVGFFSYFADDQTLRELTLWQMGSLTTSQFTNLWLLFFVSCVTFFIFQKFARSLNALLLGEAEAHHLGINIERVKGILITTVAVGVGFAVANSGIIAFVGLVTPHIIRLSVGPNHQALLPLSALCGATLVLFSDIFSRVIVAPAELPIGLVTALIGAPFFLFILLRQRRI